MNNFETAIKAEARRVIRFWMPYSPEQRADLAAAHPQYKSAWGKFFYVHPDLPTKAFPRRKLAAQAALGVKP